MNERTPPRITPETPIGPDVDLAQEDVRLADGTRLTPEVAEDIVEQGAPGHGPAFPVRHGYLAADRVPGRRNPA